MPNEVGMAEVVQQIGYFFYKLVMHFGERRQDRDENSCGQHRDVFSILGQMGFKHFCNFHSAFRVRIRVEGEETQTHVLQAVGWITKYIPEMNLENMTE